MSPSHALERVARINTEDKAKIILGPNKQVAPLQNPPFFVIKLQANVRVDRPVSNRIK